MVGQDGDPSGVPGTRPPVPGHRTSGFGTRAPGTGSSASVRVPTGARAVSTLAAGGAAASAISAIRILYLGVSGRLGSSEGTGILQDPRGEGLNIPAKEGEGGGGEEKKLGMEKWGLRACFYRPKWDANVIGLEGTRDKENEECTEK